jgi:hypothetical protein
VVECGVGVAAAFGVGGEGEAFFEGGEEALLDEELLDRVVDDEVFGEGGGLAADVGGEGFGDRVGEEGGDLFHGLRADRFRVWVYFNASFRQVRSSRSGW